MLEGFLDGMAIKLGIKKAPIITPVVEGVKPETEEERLLRIKDAQLKARVANTGGSLVVTAGAPVHSDKLAYDTTTKLPVKTPRKDQPQY